MSDFHYDQNKLNKIFAIATLVLLVVIGGMFMRDYDREWKEYQKQFHVMEMERARVKYDALQKELEADPEYQDLLKELEEAKAAYEVNCSDFAQVKADIKELQAENDLLVQKYKFRKAELDAAKYRFEHAKAHHAKNIKSVTEDYLALKMRVDELAIAVEESNTALKSKQLIIENCGEELKEIERKETKAEVSI